MNNTTIIMDGILRVTVILIVGGVFFRLIEMADKHFNKKDDE